LAAKVIKFSRQSLRIARCRDPAFVVLVADNAYSPRRRISDPKVLKRHPMAFGIEPRGENAAQRGRPGYRQAERQQLHQRE